jgi:hypothetical protein
MCSARSDQPVGTEAVLDEVQEAGAPRQLRRVVGRSEEVPVKAMAISSTVTDPPANATPSVMAGTHREAT